MALGSPQYLINRNRYFQRASHPTYHLTDPLHVPVSLLTTEGHQERGLDSLTPYPQFNEVNQGTDDSFLLMYENELGSHGFNSQGAAYHVFAPTITKTRT